MNLESKQGVVINKVNVNSLAEKSGLTTGMIILEINRNIIKSISDFNNELKNSNIEDGILLLVLVNGNARYITIKSNVK